MKTKIIKRIMKTEKRVHADLMNLELTRALEVIGFKILIRMYECPVGTIEVITKKDGLLHFFFIDRTEKGIADASNYYILRYGIDRTKFRTISL